MGFGKVNEIEVDAFREEKSTKMSLCFTVQQEMYIEEGQENSVNHLNVGEASAGTSHSQF